MKSRTIDIPIYFGKLTMLLVDDFSELDQSHDIKIKDELYDAVFFELKDNDEYIVAIKKVDLSIVAHEIVHIVNAIFLSCGIELDRRNDEPQAYLTGWIFKQIYNFIEDESK